MPQCINIVGGGTGELRAVMLMPLMFWQPSLASDVSSRDASTRL